jgi:hypothetical protein
MIAGTTGREEFLVQGMTGVDLSLPIAGPGSRADRRAKALGISRNRLVVRALEQSVRVRSEWAPEFLEQLRRVDPETSAAADELLNAVKRARRSKEPRVL